MQRRCEPHSRIVDVKNNVVIQHESIAQYPKRRRLLPILGHNLKVALEIRSGHVTSGGDRIGLPIYCDIKVWEVFMRVEIASAGEEPCG